MRQENDQSFLALPLRGLADAALSRAARLGATNVSCRIGRVRTGRVLMRDGTLQGSQDTTDLGMSVRLGYHGVIGSAGSVDLTPAGAARTAERAVAIARACQELGAEPVEWADEPVYAGADWVSPCRIDPLEVPEADRVDLLARWSRQLLSRPHIVHVMAKLTAVRENKFYADLAGTVTTQQRTRIHPQLLAVGVDPRDGTAVTLRTLGPPVGRGWEYLAGDGWDWAAELAELPDQLAGKLAARPVEPGVYDLVMDPSHLWLTIHESVGHATELDRALGHEISYAGGSFATARDLGELRYGSPLMNVTGDRITPHALATIGFDDEGVAAQSWNLIENGVLTGTQCDRGTARMAGLDRSTGCSFAESGTHLPLTRLANVSLRPAPDGPGTGALIAGVDDGIYLVGSNSWSIDMQRRHFQFTAQRAYRIRHGRLAGQLSGVTYQADTTEFWRALTGIGGEQTYGLFGADLCGKGQPVQAAAASHGCPSALFSGIRVINTGDGTL